MQPSAILFFSLVLLPLIAPATELLHGGARDVNALPVSENRWQTHWIHTTRGIDESAYKSLVNLDFFALEYGESFPETAFDTTGTNSFRRLFGYSKDSGGAGIRFGRGWNRYVMSRYGFDIDIDQSGDTDWTIFYHKASGAVSEVKFSVLGKGRVRTSHTLDMIVGVVDNTETSGLELVCNTRGVKGAIHAFRLVPRIVPLSWRRTFTLPADPVRAGLTMRNFPVFTLRVNGRVIGEGNCHGGGGFRCFDLTGALTAGLNEVSVDAETAGGYGPTTGFCAELFTVADDGTLTRFDSDDRWEYSFDGEKWEKPFAGNRVGLDGNAEVGEYASSTMPLHAGALDVRPDDPNGYPVFDFDRPVRWSARYPKGIASASLTAVARETLDRRGCLVDAAKARIFPGTVGADGVTFSGLPVGAYDIAWELKSGERIVDRLSTEMVVCGPIGQTESSAADFEKVLQPRLKLVQSVDCTREEKDETRFLDHSSPFGTPRVNVGRVVDLGNGIRARESGPNEFDYFSYRLDVGRLGAPHILEIDVPDVREQMLYCWIGESYRVNFCNNGGELGSQSWPNATGSVKCGGLMPLTGMVKKLRIVFFPGTRLVTASFERGKTGGPVAVCGFRVYEVTDDLPALRVPPTDRRYGNHNERQVYSAWGAYVDPAAIRYEMCGPSPRGWTAAFAAARNRTAYLRYAGHNSAIEGAYMYRNGFPTRSGESESYEDGFDFRYPLLKMYRHNGIHAFVGYEYMRSPALGAKGLLDVSDRQVQSGTSRTVYEVDKDGRQHVAYMGNGINFLNPDVRASMLNVAREIYARYAPVGGIEGLYVITGGWWLPGIVTGGDNGVRDVSYDDDTIELFEKETGIRLGCGWSGRERFMRRYEKLNGEHAGAWYGWRAKKLRDALEELRSVVSSGPAKWPLFASGLRAFDQVNPFSRLGGTAAGRNAYESEMRERSGYPVGLYGEGSGSDIRVLPMGEFGREIYLDDYGSLFNPGAAAIRWRADGCYFNCGSLNEHWISCPAAKKWWWFNNGVCVYDAKQCGENAFFDCVEACVPYTPRYVFHSWTDVNVTSGHADECRRFAEAFYSTPSDRHPQPLPEVKGILARRYGDSAQLINATPWPVTGTAGGEALTVPPYGIVVRKLANGTFAGEFRMAEGCPHADFAAARIAYDYETMRREVSRTRSASFLPNQNRFLAALAKSGVARVDAGSAVETVDEKGVVWLPDQEYSGSDIYGNEFARYVNRGLVAIANTDTPSVYRTESGAGVERIVYHFPVPKGTYRLVCHIAETWDTLPGHLMDVTVNGQSRRVDVWQTCGGRMRAGQIVFDGIRVPDDGEIVYDSTSRPIANAFEIFDVSDPIPLAKPYHDLRGGTACARIAVKRDICGWQWVECAIAGDRFRRDDLKFDYAKEFERLLNSKYSLRHEFHVSGYSPDLWWAQYWPGGRHTSCYGHFIDTDTMLAEYAKDPEAAMLHFEVILRQSVRREPNQTKVLIHGDDPEFVAACREGREHPLVTFAERLAGYYGIPSLNLAKAAAELGPSGPRRAVKAFFEAAFDQKDVPERFEPVKLPPPLMKGLNDNCVIVMYDDGAVRLKGDWQRGAKSVHGYWQHMLKPAAAGATMEMEFRGTEIGLIDFTRADGATYEYRVDGGEWRLLAPSAAKAGFSYAERHTVFAERLAFSGAVMAASDADRHTVELRVAKPGDGLIVGFLVNGSTADDNEPASPHTLEYIDGVYAGMKPVSFSPAPDAHRYIPGAMKRLAEGGELRIVLLGDSLVNDTCSSDFELLLMRRFPKCKVVKIASVRGSTGCTWYMRDDRVEGWVASHKPDLLMIGGISNLDDAEAVRSVVRQARAKIPGLEVVLMTPVFGCEGNARLGSYNVGWDYDPDKAAAPFRRQLRAVAAEEKCAFIDMCAEQRKYCLESGFDIGWFKRDGVHANERGKQLLGRLLDCWFAAPSAPTASNP